MYNKILTIALLTMALIAPARAVVPGWSINPAAFEYSMLVTSVAVIDSVELKNPGDKIAAFSGNQLCGVAEPVYINAIDRNVFYLMVMSNTSSGSDTIRFKVYNAASDSITEAVTTLVFERNASPGSAQQPVVISNTVGQVVAPNYPPAALLLSCDSVAENLPAGTVVGTFSTIDPDENEYFVYSATTTNPFRINGNQLLTTEPLNYELQFAYSVTVIVTDKGNHQLSRQFALKVLNKNDMPVVTGLQGDTVIANLPPGITVGLLQAIDEDPDDELRFSLSAGEADNQLFSVNPVNGLLKTIASIPSESSPLTVKVVVTDQRGGHSLTPVQVVVADKGITLDAQRLTVTLAVADTATQVCYVDGNAIRIQLIPVDGNRTFRVQCDTELTEYSMYSSAGILLEQGQPASNSFLVKVDRYGIGTYLLRIRTDKGIITRKLVVSAISD